MMCAREWGSGVKFSAYFHRGYRAFPGSWTREGTWLVARWPLRHHGGQVYELETAIQVDEDVPAEPPPAAAPLAALLIPAMRRGRHRVLLPGPLDAASRANLPRLQALLSEFYPKFKLRPVPVRARAAGPCEGDAGGPQGSRVGVFASNGVDSFFSLLAHQEEIDDLILVRGLDIGLEPELDGLWDEVVDAGRGVARELGKRLVPVRTNVRPFYEQRHTPWGIAHGAALAHVALLLQPWLRALYLPSSFDSTRLIPWGSHPELDPLWSTDHLEIIHDGVEYSRLEKTQRIVESPLALRHLRVCNAHPEGAYNCGRCRKCLTTMMGLETVGALQRCVTFPNELTARDIRAVPGWKGGGTLFLDELRGWWRRNDPDHELLPVVEEILDREDAADPRVRRTVKP